MRESFEQPNQKQHDLESIKEGQQSHLETIKERFQDFDRMEEENKTLLENAMESQDPEIVKTALTQLHEAYESQLALTRSATEELSKEVEERFNWMTKTRELKD